jgi:hypothetical protein
MKDTQEVQNRIRQLLTEHFERRCADAEERLPRRCVYNYRHTLDARKRVDGEPNPSYNRITRGDSHVGLPVLQTIGLCTYGSDHPEKWNGDICEDPIDAQRCPLFKARMTRDLIKKEFEAQIKDADWVKENMPEVQALLWVLGSEEGPLSEDPPPPTEELRPPPPPTMPSLWTRLWLWVRGHPVLPSKDN